MLTQEERTRLYELLQIFGGNLAKEDCWELLTQEQREELEKLQKKLVED